MRGGIQLASKAHKRSLAVSRMKGLVLSLSPFSKVAEEYRSTRTNLYFLMKNKGSKSLVVTSAKKAEGKTTSVTNLAISMAKGNEKVLIVDANFRRPFIHTIFNLPNQLGFLDVLKGTLPMKEVMYHSYVPNLDVLTSGDLSSNSLEVINSQRIITFLEEVSQHYDRIIIDAPPILEAAEVRFLASRSDGVILISCKNKTKIDEFAEAKRALEVAGANLIGVVLNEKNQSLLDGYFF